MNKGVFTYLVIYQLPKLVQLNFFMLILNAFCCVKYFVRGLTTFEADEPYNVFSPKDKSLLVCFG